MILRRDLRICVRLDMEVLEQCTMHVAWSQRRLLPLKRCPTLGSRVWRSGRISWKKSASWGNWTTPTRLNIRAASFEITRHGWVRYCNRIEIKLHFVIYRYFCFWLNTCLLTYKLAHLCKFINHLQVYSSIFTKGSWTNSNCELKHINILLFLCQVH